MLKRKTTKKAAPPRPTANQKLPFIEHVHELRRRLFYVAVSVGIGSLLAYAFEHRLVDWLLKPAKGQHFIYTSPLGGVDFLFRLSLYVGVVLSIPLIVYQLLRYLEPLIDKNSARFIAIGSTVSGVLALAGLVFGYFMGLPAAMGFLLHQFVNVQIQPMLTIQSYMSFVMVYMLGSAMLFQLPLLLIFINRIKPLKPSKLFHYERWVILGAFVLSGLMNPTPNLLAQLIVAGPIIVMYQVGIGIIAFLNRAKKPGKTERLRARDQALQAERLERLATMRTVWRGADALGEDASLVLKPPLATASIGNTLAPEAIPVVPDLPVQPQGDPPRVNDVLAPARSQKYANGYINLRGARRSAQPLKIMVNEKA